MWVGLTFAHLFNFALRHHRHLGDIKIKVTNTEKVNAAHKSTLIIVRNGPDSVLETSSAI